MNKRRYPMTIIQENDQTLLSANCRSRIVCTLFQTKYFCWDVIWDIEDHLGVISLTMIDTMHLIVRRFWIISNDFCGMMVFKIKHYWKLCCCTCAVAYTFLLPLGGSRAREYEYHHSSSVRALIEEQRTNPSKLLKSYNALATFFCSGNEEEYFSFLAQEHFDYEH